MGMSLSMAADVTSIRTMIENIYYELKMLREATENLNETVKQLLEFLKTEQIHVRMTTMAEM